MVLRKHAFLMASFQNAHMLLVWMVLLIIIFYQPRPQLRMASSLMSHYVLMLVMCKQFDFQMGTFHVYPYVVWLILTIRLLHQPCLKVKMFGFTLTLHMVQPMLYWEHGFQILNLDELVHMLWIWMMLVISPCHHCNIGA